MLRSVLKTNVLLFLVASSFGVAQQPTGLGPGPGWRGPVRPSGANEVFATGDGCAMCHSAAPLATAMRTATGHDVSPHGLWQGTMMAHSFRDPFFRAQMARERLATPEKSAEVEALCLKCHAPMAVVSAKLGQLPPPRFHELQDSALANDGVSCTVCHQIQPEGLGTEATFSGNFLINRDRVIFGPYENPAFGPMRQHSHYMPTHGEHIRSSALCGSCHTLTTEHMGRAFKEQTPYLEWRNSQYSDEPQTRSTSKSCQECHMPTQGAMKIARNPPGRDFNIARRPNYAAHVFAGGNAFMLDLLRVNAADIGITRPGTIEALAQTAYAARRQLATETTNIDISAPERRDGKLLFTVTVENLTGHKFPTGYPARRAWLHVDVRQGGRSIFTSGGFDESGKLEHVEDELALPHRDRVASPEEVVVYECVPMDIEGRPTTQLTAMTGMRKDNRLLPKGWKIDGPGIQDIAPVGVDGDSSFLPGGDSVRFEVPISESEDRCTIVVWMRYQTVPPAWVNALRTVDDDEARRFVRMYDSQDKTPEVAGLMIRSEE